MSVPLMGLSTAFETFAAGDALDYEVVKQTTDTFELNVTGCRYAKFYQELGAPELGFLLTCGADFAFAEGFGGDVQLTRTQTIMQGPITGLTLQKSGLWSIAAPARIST